MRRLKSSEVDKKTSELGGDPYLEVSNSAEAPSTLGSLGRKVGYGQLPLVCMLPALMEYVGGYLGGCPAYLRPWIGSV